LVALILWLFLHPVPARGCHGCVVVLQEKLQSQLMLLRGMLRADDAAQAAAAAAGPARRSSSSS
jgi:hypothetical protein